MATSSSGEVAVTSSNFPELLARAKRGDVGPQYALGLAYHKAAAAATNDTAAANANSIKALKWFRKAAEQGHADAQEKLGSMLLSCFTPGREVRQPHEREQLTEALAWLHRAAERNCGNAQYMLGVAYNEGMGVRKTYSEAAKWYRLAADVGHPDAQAHLGLFHRVGYPGVQQDLRVALALFTRAAEQGNDLAQINLGQMYYYGEGVPKDREAAAKWFLKAVTSARDDSLEIVEYNLGKMYLAGDGGLPQDPVQAAAWFTKAAHRGSEEAQYSLSQLYSDGKGVQRDDKKAMELLRQSAAQGYFLAVEALAKAKAKSSTTAAAQPPQPPPPQTTQPPILSESTGSTAPQPSQATTLQTQPAVFSEATGSMRVSEIDVGSSAQGKKDANDDDMPALEAPPVLTFVP